MPVRWRLTVWYALFLTVAFLVFGIGMYAALRFTFYTALDEQVEDQTGLILLTIQNQGGTLLLYPRDIGDLENDEHFVRLLRPDGEVVTDTSTSFAGVPLDESLVAEAVTGETTLTSADAGGETFRLVTAPVMPGNEVIGILQVGMSREEIDEALRTLVLLLLVSGPIVLAVAGIGGYTLAGRAIAPVSDIARRAESVDVDDLRTRLNLDLADDELGRLARTFDTMLDRIEQAFDQQRRFTGNAAHELRTPLTLMRGRVDLALSGQHSADEYREALGALQGDITRLADLVSALLALARADAGQLVVSRAPIDLVEMITDVQEQFSDRAERAGVRQVQHADACIVDADEDLLVLVLVNLVANALAATPAGGTLTLGCRTDAASATLRVADTGVGIPPDQQERIFDRFYRVDHGLDRNDAGAGLGLSISRAIVSAHRGRIDLVSDPAHGTTVTVILPLGKDDR